jgi:hypothetical protein
MFTDATPAVRKMVMALVRMMLRDDARYSDFMR